MKEKAAKQKAAVDIAVANVMKQQQDAAWQQNRLTNEATAKRETMQSSPIRCPEHSKEATLMQSGDSSRAAVISSDGEMRVVPVDALHSEEFDHMNQSRLETHSAIERAVDIHASATRAMLSTASAISKRDVIDEEADESAGVVMQAEDAARQQLEAAWAMNAAVAAARSPRLEPLFELRPIVHPFHVDSC